ncbi:MAG: hypothetical protein U9Q70_11645 [Chloroflexota bacterium]|nr:hypothetical protein [Chloroflexota bacterium]
MTWKSAIIRLQGVDLELNSARQQLAEVRCALKDDVELQQTRARAVQCAAIAKQAAREQRNWEFKVNQVAEHRTSVKSRLYGGAIRNPRELEDLQAKMASLQRHKEDLEDKLFEIMFAREEADDAASAVARTLAQTEEQWQAQHAELTARQEELQQYLGTLKLEVTELEGRIPTEILASYRRLQQRMGNPAIARLNGNICGVCGIEVISPRRRAAQAGKEVYCDSCGRLLIA